MNEHMLMVIDHQINPGKYTKEQLRQNASDASYVSTVSFSVRDTANTAATYAANIAATYAANAAAAHAYAGDVVDYWVRRYFEDSSENKQDYVDEINKRDKQ